MNIVNKLLILALGVALVAPAVAKGRTDVGKVILTSVGGPHCNGKTVQHLPASADVDWGKWHVKQKKVNPHYVISRDGRVAADAPEHNKARMAGIPADAIAIVLVNHGDGNDPFDDTQMRTLAKLIRSIELRWGEAEIIYHDEISDVFKTCGTHQYKKWTGPGNNFDRQLLFTLIDEVPVHTVTSAKMPLFKDEALQKKGGYLIEGDTFVALTLSDDKQKALIRYNGQSTLNRWVPADSVQTAPAATNVAAAPAPVKPVSPVPPQGNKPIWLQATEETLTVQQPPQPAVVTGPPSDVPAAPVPEPKKPVVKPPVQQSPEQHPDTLDGWLDRLFK